PRLFIVAHGRRSAPRLDQAGEFRSRENRGNAIESPGGRGIKVHDTRMRIRAPQESRVEESRRVVIVCICSLTCQETPIFPALDSCPHQLRSELFHVTSPCYTAYSLWLIAYGLWLGSCHMLQSEQ